MTKLPDGINPYKNNQLNPANYTQNPYMPGMNDDQNLGMGIIAGLAAAIIGGVLWAVITYYAGIQIGWMAVGVGLLVGFSIRHFGKGKDVSFSIAGAFFALMGCLLGNVFTVCMYISVESGEGIFEVLSGLDFSTISNYLIASFQPMDALFYGIAIYEGFKYSVVKTIPDKENKS
ncbi:MAG: hypothetical protein ABIJ12_06665 [bacterium]